MYYFLISLSALLFSFQFAMNGGFQREDGAGWDSSLRFSLYSSLVGFVLLFVINGFRLHCSPFSLAVALGYSLICIAYNFSSVKALEKANLSLYSVFSMIGGMVVPFLYGVICGEAVKPLHIVCCVLMTVAVVVSVGRGERSGKALKYYIGVFFLNGAVGSVSKFHQSHREWCVDSADFLMLTKLLTVVLSVVLLLAQKERNFRLSQKALAYASGSSALNSIANLLLLISLLHLPASVQYPIVTGGVIVFSTIIDLIGRSGAGKRKIIAAGIAFAASAMMML